MCYVWEEIRRLAMTFNLCNHVFANCFYAGKILSFTWSVLGSFYVLRFGIIDLVSAAMALVAVDAIMFYLLCCGNAYVITDTMGNVLQMVKLTSQSHAGMSRRELKQRIKSVQDVALAEGGFRKISRETTPEFVDFYVNTVIALVLAF